MRLVSFISNDRVGHHIPRIGALLMGDQLILDFSAAMENQGGIEHSSYESFLSCLDLDGEWLQRAFALHAEIDCSGIQHENLKGVLIDRSDAHLLAPVPRPGKLICVGLNYRDHAAESKMPIPKAPIIFSKFTTSVIGPGQPVIIPPKSERVDYEAELAVVIGRRAKQVDRALALAYVLGYTVFNDVSEREFQFADGQWQRGKSCDTFAPMGPYIATTDEITDPHKSAIRLRLNGRTMQDSNTENMIFGVPELIAFISETITLEPGDVIATGTPPGVGFARKPPVFLKRGDVMDVEIDGLGVLSNPIS